MPSPHKLAFDPVRRRLFVANGRDGVVEVFGSDLSHVATIPVGAKPDTGALDPVARLFYVSSRAGGADATTSRISAISLDTLRVVRSFDVPATTLKGLVLDRAGQRLFVSMRDRNAIGVIELAGGQVSVWTSKDLNRNVPLVLDATSGRLFVGSREPGRLVVLDARDGRQIQTLPATETADSMSWDADRRLLLVSGDTGVSRYRVAPDGTATWLGTDGALVGKTSLYVPALRRFYLLRPRKGAVDAALQVYAVGL
ncbi:hypothetical protein SR41_16620 [Sphingomonas melonis]|uniref:YncE family protein n=1 Tax=Sphingomonas melonis TaxID=152682 RepID=A0A0D1M5A2_9SPHN|nr:hypothetical protein [Sphingomonas melonis]KIU26002.1 hypothetical protein SR41_16620 [Sphingomonas melonis]